MWLPAECWNYLNLYTHIYVVSNIWKIGNVTKYVICSLILTRSWRLYPPWITIKSQVFVLHFSFITLSHKPYSFPKHIPLIVKFHINNIHKCSPISQKKKLLSVTKQTIDPVYRNNRYAFWIILIRQIHCVRKIPRLCRDKVDGSPNYALQFFKLAFLSKEWFVVPSQTNVAISLLHVTTCWWVRTFKVSRHVVTILKEIPVAYFKAVIRNK